MDDMDEEQVRESCIAEVPTEVGEVSIIVEGLHWITVSSWDAYKPLLYNKRTYLLQQSTLVSTKSGPDLWEWQTLRGKSRCGVVLLNGFKPANAVASIMIGSKVHHAVELYLREHRDWFLAAARRAVASRINRAEEEIKDAERDLLVARCDRAEWLVELAEINAESPNEDQ